MGNSFRLRSSTMFTRSEEEIKEEPLRIVFLSVEGNETEINYFKWVEKYRHQLGIKACVHICPLERAKSDNQSAPENVLELLEEYLELRNAENLPELLREVIPQKYSDEFIENYVNNTFIGKNNKIKEFETLLHETGIDLAYAYYLNEVKGDRDIFGVVIDRDYDPVSESRSVPHMENIVSRCKEKGYQCFVTTPSFEFWLLLHLVDVRKEYPDELEALKKNKHVSNKHTFTSKKVSDIAGHAKSINEKKFVEFYLTKIDFAIEQVKNSFSTELNELIGDDSSEQSKMGQLGSNLPELFQLLRDV